jgi:hypothetical protein
MVFDCVRAILDWTGLKYYGNQVTRALYCVLELYIYNFPYNVTIYTDFNHPYVSFIHNHRSSNVSSSPNIPTTGICQRLSDCSCISLEIFPG